MSTAQLLQTKSYPVAADYSSTGIHRFMTLNTSEQAALAAARGAKVLGILQDNPAAAGRPGSIGIAGTSKITYGGTILEDDPLTSSATGTAIRATRPDDEVFGYADVSGVSGNIGEMRISPTGPLSGDQPAWSEDFASYATADVIKNTIVTGGMAAGTDATLHHCRTADGKILGYVPINTQTITGPVKVANGLDFGMDQTDTDGVEVFSGMMGASGRPFRVGTDRAFYFLCQIEVTDVSGTDDLQIGLRSNEGVRPAWDDYTDAAAIGFITTADPAAVQTQTILAGAATGETDTTDTHADTVVVQYKLLVSAAGVVTFQHDIAAIGTLAAPTAVGAYTFADGLWVVPFMRFINDAGLADAVIIHKWEVDYQ